MWANMSSDFIYNTISSSTNKMVCVDIKKTCLSVNYKSFAYFKKGECVTTVRNFPFLPFREPITVYIV